MMKHVERPVRRPRNPLFSSGPCTKFSGWSYDHLKDACLGRSHRSQAGKGKLKRALDETKAILGLPDDYLVAIVPASDTGAVEMALWSLLGPRGVDVLAWDAFGHEWVRDITEQLKIDDVRALAAPYGALPDLGLVDFSRDVVFAWNGTTSGIRVPHADWIRADRDGLTICDATSAVFVHDLVWEKLDVVTYSWQKVVGGEAAHGMLILSPRAVARLESYVPPWPIPKILRLTAGGQLIGGLFEGETLNTPSLLCVEDYLVALRWARSVGGLNGLIERSACNAGLVSDWVARISWIDFLGGTAETRSHSSVCLKIVEEKFAGLPEEGQRAFVKKMVHLLEQEGAAFDVGGHRKAPPSLRIWCGATVEAADIEALLPWLDWAFYASYDAYFPAR